MRDAVTKSGRFFVGCARIFYSAEYNGRWTDGQQIQFRVSIPGPWCLGVILIDLPMVVIGEKRRIRERSLWRYDGMLTFGRVFERFRFRGGVLAVPSRLTVLRAIAEINIT